jgi:hypothetical protein
MIAKSICQKKVKLSTGTGGISVLSQRVLTQPCSAEFEDIRLVSGISSGINGSQEFDLPVKDLTQSSRTFSMTLIPM